MLLALAIVAALAAAHTPRQYGYIPQECVRTCGLYTNIMGQCSGATVDPSCSRICKPDNFADVTACMTCVYKTEGASQATINSAIVQYADGCAGIGMPVTLPEGVTNATEGATWGGGGGTSVSWSAAASEAWSAAPSGSGTGWSDLPDFTPWGPGASATAWPSGASASYSVPPGGSASYSSSYSAPSGGSAAYSSRTDSGAYTYTTRRYGHGSVSRFPNFTNLPAAERTGI
ncbi:hypothetical protein Q8F55_003579 [Vanrija albida]|uniref:Extracellular membrane protein CFEM domain-containing protein n=1 Tax=Vanrija albida TaxID=181172 RepID=A0ABR3Q4Q4_9TREE